MRVLITGATGQVGGRVLGCLRRLGHQVIAWSGESAATIDGVTISPVDLTNATAVREAWWSAVPDLLIHAAAIASVAQAFHNPDRAQAVNVAATALLAELAAAARTRLVYLSTDLVFDGEKGNYREDDVTRPTSVYGRTKLAGEAPVLDDGLGLVLRLSLLYGPSINDRPTFFEQQCDALRQHRDIALFDDEWRTPLGLSAAAEGVVAAALSPTTGLLHLGGRERLTRYDVGLRLALTLGVSTDGIARCSRLSISSPEPRPKDTSLDSSRFATLFPHVLRPAFDEPQGEER